MNVLYSILVLAIWFMSTFVIVLMLLVILSKRKTMDAEIVPPKNLPKVSIVLPAFNEETGILPALKSLAAIEYPKPLYEIIVVNDGSKDNTSGIVREFMDENKGVPIVFLDRRQNRGKSYSLNEGTRNASGDLVACMDGDSIVRPDILSKTVGYFKDKKVASVSVRVNVQDPKNVLEKIIDVEYSVGLSISLKVLSMLDSMHVTPGPFSIYRKSVLLEVGGFDEKNITEDLEIAFRIQKSGYKMAFCLSTGVSTKVPSDLKSLSKQRNRWYSGSLITVWRHRDLLLNRRMKVFGVFLPFNYSLIVLGMVLFVYTLYIVANNIFIGLNHMRLVNFDLLLSNFTLSFDPLSIDVFTIMSVTMILMTVLLTKTSYTVIRRKVRDNFVGFFGFLFFFIFYQIFWFNAFYSVLRGREIKWR
ncbi:MAG: glycosyltransferase [Candidatus Altiarchaeota archaeon]|nr:glycosyltransferase [Candidatus Altiarchaeota archaeon]